MLSPLSKKNVQRLNGTVDALSILISRSSDKCHRFLKILKGKNYFEWLQELKKYLEI